MRIGLCIYGLYSYGLCSYGLWHLTEYEDRRAQRRLFVWRCGVGVPDNGSAVEGVHGCHPGTVAATSMIACMAACTTIATVFHGGMGVCHDMNPWSATDMASAVCNDTHAQLILSKTYAGQPHRLPLPSS